MNRTNVNHQSCFFLNVNLAETDGTFIASILTCILNVVFSLLTSIGNFIILHVIWKKEELHSPSLTLLFCLAASDLLVGLICQPFYVAYQISWLVDNLSAYCVLRMIHSISGWITSSVSLQILSVFSVDRLLALTLNLRYNTIVTVRRILQTVTFLWTLAITAVISRLWIVTEIWIFVPVVLFLLTFFVITLSTLKIFQIVRRHQRQISQQQQSVQFNTNSALKCRKSAVTLLYVYGLFLIFYVPFFVTMVVETFTGYTLTVKIAYDYVTTVVYINSFLNPLVYCWRIKEIRQAIKNTLRKN
ncbi:trace amine-associated receptor 7e-like [Oculina patagonica]